MQNINNRGNWAREHGVYEDSVFSVQISGKPKISLKTKFINKNQEIL